MVNNCLTSENNEFASCQSSHGSDLVSSDGMAAIGIHSSEWEPIVVGPHMDKYLTLYVLHFSEQIKTFIYITSFLRTNMIHAVQNHSLRNTRTYLFYIMSVDDLVTQGAKASATMIIT